MSAAAPLLVLLPLLASSPDGGTAATPPLPVVVDAGVADAADGAAVVASPSASASSSGGGARAKVAAFSLSTPPLRLFRGRKDVAGLSVQAVDADGQPVDWKGAVTIRGVTTSAEKNPPKESEIVVAANEKGLAKLPAVTLTDSTLTISAADGTTTNAPLRQIPGWLTLLPAILAIALALWLKEVVFALLGGIYAGAVLLHGDPFSALPASLDLMIVVVADASKIKVVVFTLGMGGLVGLVAAAGGTQGIVNVVSRYAKDARSTSLATWLMGMVIFFDDYASTLLVGNTMRPVSDRYRISREKLAYLVDSTAATITSLALVSTWIGYEVSTMQTAMIDAGIKGDAYTAFISGLPSRFYPILALLFVGMVAFSRRDFGPMAKAEERARRTGLLLREGAAPLVDDEVAQDAEAMAKVQPRAWFAAVAIGGLIFSVVLALVILGSDASYDALLYGSGFSLMSSIAVAIGSRALTLKESLDATVRGLRAMALAVLVLMLAWSVGKIMGDLAAGHYVATLVSGALPAWALPTVTFLLAAVMALSTGTSWGTMAILFPVVIPVVATFTKDPTDAIFLTTTSAVLAGAVFGDHCSPISDTTVLSSVASASDHVDHTKTQMPYAVVVGTISIVFGTLPAGFGVPPLLCLVVGLLALVAVLRFVARPIPEAADIDGASASG